MCIVVASAAVKSVAHAQVKCSALRQKLFMRVSAILDGSGAPGSGDTLLRAEVHNQLRLFSEDFSSEPAAAVFVEHIRAHYAARPGEQQCADFAEHAMPRVPVVMEGERTLQAHSMC